MVIDINNIRGTHDARTQTSSKANVSANNGQVAQQANSAPTSEQRPEVQLSSQAQSLRNLEDKLQDAPEVNIARVDAIKQALEEGSYEVNDLVVADKLIQAEGLFS